MPYFRSTRSGRVAELSADAASLFPDLKEVGKDAKPLAFTTIPEAQVAAVKPPKKDEA